MQGQILESLRKTVEKLANPMVILVLRKEYSETRDAGAGRSDNGEGRRGSSVPFPTFDGSNYREWRAKCEQFFDPEQTPEGQRSKLIILSMEGKAFTWQRHYSVVMGARIAKWRQILRDIGDRFDEEVYDDPLADLAKLKQTAGLKDYMTEVDKLLAKTSIDSGMTLSLFFSGLDLEIAVCLHNPRSVQEAMWIARLQENILMNIKPSSSSSSKSIPPSSLSRPYKPFSLPYYLNTQFSKSPTTPHSETKPTTPSNSKLNPPNKPFLGDLVMELYWECPGWNCALPSMTFEHQGETICFEGEKLVGGLSEVQGKLKMITERALLLAVVADNSTTQGDKITIDASLSENQK
ncbi:hypothetical protein L6164_005721 [Bauhinia variegata]|uniref:Uncharacterized protein n=1 Tax=Bauhinia variegata TaxID=167791 RepID=A0ACB9PU97_BAUVA|nr:hypothetical protein L6164_005721 [Bauhinia variegata]